MSWAPICAQARSHRLSNLRRHHRHRSTSTARAPVLPAPAAKWAIQVNLLDKHRAAKKSHAIAVGASRTCRRSRPALRQRKGGGGAAGPPVLAPIVAEIYGPEAAVGVTRGENSARTVFEKTTGVVDADDSSIASAPKKLLIVDRRKAAMLGVPQQAIVPYWSQCRARRRGHAAAARRRQIPGRVTLQPPLSATAISMRCCSWRAQHAEGARCRRELVDRERHRANSHVSQGPCCRCVVVGDMAGKPDSPLYGMFSMRSEIAAIHGARMAD